MQVEQLGGEIQSIEVSATKKTNLDKLEEAILLQAEVLELKANPDRPADGVVIEAKLDQGRGSVATVLVQHGTLKVGDVLVAGAVWGRVRRLIDDRGNAVKAPARRSRSRSWVSTARRRRVTNSTSWRARRVPARSPTSAPVATGRPSSPAPRAAAARSRR